MANKEIRIEIDEDLMKEFEALCKKNGTTSDVAIVGFISAFVRKKEFPFNLALTDKLHQSYSKNYKD